MHYLPKKYKSSKEHVEDYIKRRTGKDFVACLDEEACANVFIWEEDYLQWKWNRKRIYGYYRIAAAEG